MINSNSMNIMNSTVKLLSAPENCDPKIEMLVLVHSHPYDKGGELYLRVRLCFKNIFQTLEKLSEVLGEKLLSFLEL